jgi:murein DD-endopeptidase MepM/ murein hydrolase activator NlpD
VSALLATLPALLTTAAEPTSLRDSASVIALARSFHDAIRSDDAPTLWASLDDTMRAAVGPAENFEATLTGLVEQTGRLERCLTEVATRQTGIWIYRAGCKFVKSETPLQLTMTFDRDARISGFLIAASPEPHASGHLDYDTKTPLQLPFDGEWTVFWGGRTPEQNYHIVTRDQRFAYDFVLTRGGRTHRDDGRSNADYYCYEQAIRAPAAGKIAWLSDGLPDNRPGEMSPELPLGNGVIIDHGAGEFSVMGHLQRGSLRVKLDQQVSTGDTLARCGNSGNSSEPHLHYHLQDVPEPLAGDGLPAFFRDYLADGTAVGRGEPRRGQQVTGQ